MGLTFFGLTPNTASQQRINLFTQIHEIVFHGNGGYSWETIYNMPIWLRKFTFHRLQTYFTEQQEKVEEAQAGSKTTLIDSTGKVKAPEFAKGKKMTSYK